MTTSPRLPCAHTIRQHTAHTALHYFARPPFGWHLVQAERHLLSPQSPPSRLPLNQHWITLRLLDPITIPNSLPLWPSFHLLPGHLGWNVHTCPSNELGRPKQSLRYCACITRLGSGLQTVAPWCTGDHSNSKPTYKMAGTGNYIGVIAPHSTQLPGPRKNGILHPLAMPPQE